MSRFVNTIIYCFPIQFRNEKEKKKKREKEKRIALNSLLLLHFLPSSHGGTHSLRSFFNSFTFTFLFSFFSFLFRFFFYLLFFYLFYVIS